PPKMRTTRWPPISSSSTWVSEPERSWMSRAIRRSRRLKYRMTKPTIGTTTNVSSVKRQLSHIRYPKLTTIVSVDRIALVIAPEAADASWWASNETFDWITPAA